MLDHTNVHHEINYIELSATDMAETKRFYGEAFAWQFTEYGQEYAGIKRRAGEGDCGGICLAENVTTGGPLVILYSRDLESSFASVHKAGGRITQEIFAFSGGRRFHFLDPSGNQLAVWSDQPHQT
jgi:predicted enzyme related to lactoylglutathione lyase